MRLFMTRRFGQVTNPLLSNLYSLEPIYDKTQVDIRLFNILYCTSKRKTPPPPNVPLPSNSRPFEGVIQHWFPLNKALFVGVGWQVMNSNHYALIPWEYSCTQNNALDDFIPGIRSTHVHCQHIGHTRYFRNILTVGITFILIIL